MTSKYSMIYSTVIKPEWLDYNNHLNVANYVMIFDKAGEALFESLGLGEDSAKKRKMSWMVLENHVTYDGEVNLGQKVDVGFRLLDHDHKRLHLYFEMIADGKTPYVAATLEQMVICANLNLRKSSEFPEDVQQKIGQLVDRQTSLDMPKNIGRTIGIRRK